MLATESVAVGLGDVVVEEVDVRSDDVAVSRKDSEAPVDLALSEATLPLVEEVDSGAVGESVVRLGKLVSLPVVAESCRICRAALSELDAPEGVIAPNRDNKIT